LHVGCEDTKSERARERESERARERESERARESEREGVRKSEKARESEHLHPSGGVGWTRTVDNFVSREIGRNQSENRERRESSCCLLDSASK